MSLDEPSLYEPCALNCCVSPICSGAPWGVTAIEVSEALELLLELELLELGLLLDDETLDVAPEPDPPPPQPVSSSRLMSVKRLEIAAMCK